jgi:hypothetical protein
MTSRLTRLLTLVTNLHHRAEKVNLMVLPEENSTEQIGVVDA